MDESDIQGLLQGFSAFFHQKNRENGLTSLDHQLECAAFGRIAGG